MFAWQNFPKSSWGQKEKNLLLFYSKSRQNIENDRRLLHWLSHCSLQVWMMSGFVRWEDRVRSKARQITVPRRHISSSPCFPVTEWTTRPGRAARRGQLPQTPRPAPGKPPSSHSRAVLSDLPTALTLLQDLSLCKFTVLSKCLLLDFTFFPLVTHFADYCLGKLTILIRCLDCRVTGVQCFYLDYLALQGKTLAALHSHYVVIPGSSEATCCNFPMTQLGL